MADFSIKEAAFTGYKLARQKPGMLVMLAIFSFVISFVGMWALVSTVGPTLADMRTMGDDPASADPAAAMQMLSALPMLLAIGGGIAALSYMISAGAVARAVIRPSTSKFPYVGLGADEFRLLAVGIVVGLILLVVYLGLSIVFGLLSFAVVASTSGMESMANPGDRSPLVTIVTLGGAAISYILVFLFSVRFSLAPAQSEREEAIRIFGSWELTKHRYWAVTKAYLLAILTLVPFGVIGFAIVWAVAAATGGGTAQALEMYQGTGMTTTAEMLGPVGLTSAVVNALIGALWWMVCLGSSASVFAQVEGIATTDHNDDDDDDDDDD